MRTSSNAEQSLTIKFGRKLRIVTGTSRRELSSFNEACEISMNELKSASLLFRCSKLLPRLTRSTYSLRKSVNHSAISPPYAKQSTVVDHRLYKILIHNYVLIIF